MAFRRNVALWVMAGSAAIVACDPSGLDPKLAPDVPLAYVRFVNAVPDTIPTDWRFIDQIEYSPVMFRMTFRSFSPYQGAQAGMRRLRIFPDTTDINFVSKFFIDTTLNLVADTYYTIVHVGNTRAGVLPADEIMLLVDSAPPVPTNSFALRAVHVGIGLLNQDVYASRSTGALPASPTFTDIGYRGASAYSMIANDTLVLRTTNAGTVSVNATATAPVGTAAKPDSNLTATGGSRIPGSALSAFYFPRSVVGSPAPQGGAFNAPAIVYLIDRHPR
jgi:hypothetical protein